MRDRFEHTLERRPADNADGAVTTVRRLELINGHRLILLIPTTGKLAVQ
jgi:hypothetical protein